VPRLPDVDRELESFGKTEAELRTVLERAIALRRGLADVDGALDAIRVLDGSVVESRLPAGASGRPISWEEARRPSSPPSAPGSGVLDTSEVAADVSGLPPVLAPADRPLSHATALYIDPPTHPPEPLALEPDPELGDLAPEVPVVRPPTQPPPPQRPSAIPPPNTDELLAEMLDAPEEPPPAPPEPLLAAPPPSVAEDEARGALAALMAEEERDFAALDARSSPAAIPPPAGNDEEIEDLEIDLDEDVVELEDEDEAPSAKSARSRPPPPPSRPPDTPKSRPPEPPAKGFLNRILKGGKN
jgi:hypothetical protein